MNTYFLVLSIYISLINVIALVMTVNDKARSAKGKWRISESSLIIAALLGGSFFEYLTMLIIRHKTRHPKFMVGLPIIITIHAILIAVIFKTA